MLWLSSTGGSGGSTGPGLAGWWVIALIVLAVAVVTSVRVTRPGERFVIRRFGRAHAVRGPGLVVSLPVFEQMVSVSLRPVELDPLIVRATTRDGFDVSLWARASCRVCEPLASQLVAPDALTRTAEVVERALLREIGRTDLQDLTTAPLAATARRKAATLAMEWGVELNEVEAEHTELALTDRVLDWARRSPRAPRSSAARAQHCRVPMA